MRTFPSTLFLALVVASACAPDALRDPSLGRDGGGAGQAAAGAQAGTSGGGGFAGATGSGAAAGQSGQAAVSGGMAGAFMAAGGRAPTTGMAGMALMGTGGMAFMGTGGSMATSMGGGTAGNPGTPSASVVDRILPGVGCGKPLPQGQTPGVPGAPKGYFQFTVQGTGRTLGADQPAKIGPRTFWVRVPPDYDRNRPLRVVYIGQGCGSFNNANNDTLQLYREMLGGTEQAIYVAMDIPTDNANMNCYDQRDGVLSQEWEAFELFHTVVDTNYCVDNNRIYVAGYSTGASLANMWGCYFAGDGMTPAGTPGVPRKFAPRYHIRAQAAVSGVEPANDPPCNGKVAAIWIHDAGDTGNPISGSLAALERVGRMNGCATSADLMLQPPWHPEIPPIGDVCKQFKGCPVDYPVVFCTTNGLGHSDQHDRAIPAFKLFFDQIGFPAP